MRTATAMVGPMEDVGIVSVAAASLHAHHPADLHRRRRVTSTAAACSPPAPSSVLYGAAAAAFPAGLCGGVSPAELSPVWREAIRAAGTLEEEEFFDKVVLRGIPAPFLERLSRQVLAPKQTKRQGRTRSALSEAQETMQLASALDQQPLVRERAYRVLIALSKWRPELYDRTCLQPAVVALIASSQSERVAFHAFVHIYKALALHEYLDCEEKPPFESQPQDRLPSYVARPPGLVKPIEAPSETSDSEDTSLFSATATLISRSCFSAMACVAEVAAAAASSIQEEAAAREDAVHADALKVWACLQAQYPGVADAFGQNKATLSSLFNLVIEWLETLLAKGSATSMSQLRVYAPLLNHLVCTAKLNSADPRKGLRHIVVCTLGRHHYKIEERARDPEGLRELARTFTAKPPVDATVLAMLTDSHFERTFMESANSHTAWMSGSLMAQAAAALRDEASVAPERGSFGAEVTSPSRSGRGRGAGRGGGGGGGHRACASRLEELCFKELLQAAEEVWASGRSHILASAADLAVSWRTPASQPIVKPGPSRE